MVDFYFQLIVIIFLDIAIFSLLWVLSRNKRLDWEKLIRNTVRIATLSSLIILVIEIIRSIFPEPLDETLPLLSTYSLMIIFLLGINLLIFHLRDINESRGRTISIGGYISYFGLFLTLILTFTSFNLMIGDFTFLIFGFGIFLILCGLFLEITRIDEPFVYWIKIHHKFILRSILFVMALVVMFSGIFQWRWEIAYGGHLILFFIGYLSSMIVWWKHSYFRRVSTILSLFVVLWSFSLLNQVVLSIDVPDSWIPPILFSLGIGLTLGLWINEIRDTIIKIITTIWNAFLAFGQSIYNMIILIGESIVSLSRYIWKIRIDILRGFMTIIGPILMLFAFLSPLSFAPLGEPYSSLEPFLRLVIFITGLALIYLAWRIQVNDFITQTINTTWQFLKDAANAVKRSALAIYQFMKDAVLSVSRAIVSFIHYSWSIRIQILRAFMTILGPFLMLFAFSSSFSFATLAEPYSSLEPFLRLVIFITGLVLVYLAWRIQVNDFIIRAVHVTWQFLKDAANAVKRAAIAINQFLKDATHATWQFLKDAGQAFKQAFLAICGSIWNAYLKVKIFLITYYLEILRYVISIFGLVIMFFGLVYWSSSPFIAFSLIFIGYLISFLAWYNHSYLKNAGTLLSIIIFLMSLVLLITFPYEGISGFLMIPAIINVIYLWRVEIKELIIQIKNAIFNAINRTIEAIIAFFVAIIAAVAETVVMIKSFFKSIWARRVAILRVFGTILGFALDLLGIIFLFLAWYDFSNPNIDIAIFLFGKPLVEVWFIPVLMLLVGTTLLCWIWVHQIISFLAATYNAVIKAFTEFYVFITKAIKQLSKWIVTISDSTIVIAIVILSISAIGFGLILIISGIIDPTGAWTKQYLHSIPIFGDLLWFIAAILQGITNVNEVTSLIGIWDLEHLGNDITMARLIQILLGVIFTIFGVILSVVTFFTRDSMKLSNLKSRMLDSSSEDKEIIFEGKKGVE